MKMLMLPHLYYHSSLFMLYCLASLSNLDLLEARMVTTTQGCSHSERDALLTFKSNIQDPSNRLASWNSQHDCCTWSGVLCYNDTTTINIHVVELNLANTQPLNLHKRLHIKKLSPSLLSLTHLESLNLRGNDFGSAKIPEFIGSFQNLSYLDLHASNFGGAIPPQLGNLLSIRHLDLNLEWGDNKSYVKSLDWLMHLSTLTYLDMSFVDLSAVSHNWLSTMNVLPTLQELKLSSCNLNQIPSSLSHLNLTSLVTLDLNTNNFNSTLPSWLWQLTSLSYLDLSYGFHGTIPIEIGNLTSLITLRLQGNAYEGFRPPEIENFTRLKIFHHHSNSLDGNIPTQIGKLFNLTTLDLSYNSLEGVISPLHFANLSNLQYLYLSHNSLLSIVIDHTWVPPFQLKVIALNTLKLGPTFPMWLKSHNSIIKINLSNTSIEGKIPNWFWASSTYVGIDLSYNKITGTLPLSLKNYTNLIVLNLSYNLFEGPIPKLPVNLWVVDLSLNSISRPIPPSLCNLRKLMFLDLSHNQISGEIPHCDYLEPNNLRFIHLENNNLSGKIPSSIGQFNHITSLHLNNNMLNGQIPSSLQNCSNLHILDIGSNKLSGNIPTWIGQSLQNLTVLRLRSNMFSGDIPIDIGQLRNLQIIDLANNNLIGSIPHSLGNLSAIISASRTMSSSTFRLVGSIIFMEESDTITIAMKGYEYSFSKTLFLVKCIDLSNNSLVGEIPQELGFLKDLQTLNLSRNYLKGNIPNAISGMKSLETLDLSHNILSGAIPQGLSALNYLSHLNLSYNNLSGMIPQGYQLQTLQDPSIYEGNVHLCGALINKSCLGHGNYTTIDEEHEDSLEMLAECLDITLGFLLGLWSVFVVLLFKKGWRNFYFLMVDRTYDKAYVLIKLRLNRWMQVCNIGRNLVTS